jgi:hypothetical protein
LISLSASGSIDLDSYEIEDEVAQLSDQKNFKNEPKVEDNNAISDSLDLDISDDLNKII